MQLATVTKAKTPFAMKNALADLTLGRELINSHVIFG